MQIVIDIDENLYTRLFDAGANTMRDMREACSIIRNGTPLQHIISEIKMYQADGELGMSDDTDEECRQCARNIFESVYHIIEKHKSEKSES